MSGTQRVAPKGRSGGPLRRGAEGTTSSLPAGSVVELGRRVMRYDGGRVLVGGSPPRLVRLGERALPFHPLKITNLRIR